MKRILPLIVFLMLLPFPVGADDDAVQAEIDHLIRYITESPCLFIRNGTEHAAGDALTHIMKKYEYFREEIDSAEVFIDRCASKSILSGKPYRVRCPGREPVETRTWLLEELQRFRRERHEPPGNAS